MMKIQEMIKKLRKYITENCNISNVTSLDFQMMQAIEAVKVLEQVRALIEGSCDMKEVVIQGFSNEGMELQLTFPSEFALEKYKNYIEKLGLPLGFGIIRELTKG